MSLNELLHDIVKLLPHRQEVLDDLHDRIDEHVPAETPSASDAAPAEKAPEA